MMLQTDCLAESFIIGEDDVYIRVPEASKAYKDALTDLVEGVSSFLGPDEQLFGNDVDKILGYARFVLDKARKTGQEDLKE